MPDDYTIPVSISDLSDPQLVEKTTLRAVITLTNLFETWSTIMAAELDRLGQAVDKELADDAAQNQLIAEQTATIADLQAQLGTVNDNLTAALEGEAAAQASVREALDAATAAADKLEQNDPVVPPVDEEPPPADGPPPTDETPV